MLLIRARFYKVYTRLCHYIEKENSESTLCGKKPLEKKIVTLPIQGYEPTCATCSMIKQDREK